MKIVCNECGELLLKCKQLEYVAIKCYNCGLLHSNAMLEEKLEIDELGNIKPPKLATYIQTK